MVLIISLQKDVTKFKVNHPLTVEEYMRYQNTIDDGIPEDPDNLYTSPNNE